MLIIFSLTKLFFLKNTDTVAPTLVSDVLLNSIFAKVDPTDKTLASLVLIPEGVPLSIWMRSAGENVCELKNNWQFIWLFKILFIYLQNNN